VFAAVPREHGGDCKPSWTALGTEAK
jgi:hypothetical protein